ncbi:MAG: mechanosensitive ion channel family protein, partial [Burkholderiales bacterium]
MGFARLINEFVQSQPMVFSLIVLLLFIVTIITLHTVINYAISKFSQKYKTKAVLFTLHQWRIPALFLAVLLIITFVISFLKLPPMLDMIIKHILAIASIVDITWLIISCSAIIRNMVMLRYDLNVEDNFKARKIYTQLRVIERIINIFIIIVAFSAILMTFEKIRQLGLSILASAGVLTAIIGFAAQKSIATILAGVQVAITQPIRINDVVIVENEWGVIEEITLSYVVMRIWDKRRLIIPITFFLEQTFQNWSRQSTDLLGTVFIYTDYLVPISELKQELTAILHKNPLWDGQAMALQVTDAKPNVVELRAIVSASNAGNLWNLRCEVREKLINFIGEHYH